MKNRNGQYVIVQCTVHFKGNSPLKQAFFEFSMYSNSPPSPIPPSKKNIALKTALRKPDHAIPQFSTQITGHGPRESIFYPPNVCRCKTFGILHLKGQPPQLTGQWSV